MGDVLLNGRKPLDWELAALEHGRQCERDREMEQLAGVLAGESAERVARPVTDIVWEFS